MMLFNYDMVEFEGLDDSYNEECDAKGCFSFRKSEWTEEMLLKVLRARQSPVTSDVVVCVVDVLGRFTFVHYNKKPTSCSLKVPLVTLSVTCSYRWSVLVFALPQPPKETSAEVLSANLDFKQRKLCFSQRTQNSKIYLFNKQSSDENGH